jgi:uncharacterized protein YjbI with pentapeptide repeats
MNLRSPIVLTAIGVVATLTLALLVVNALVQTGGAKAVSDNAAVIGALVALGGVFTTQMVNSALEERRAQEARNIEAQRAQDASLQAYVDQISNLMSEWHLGDRPSDSPGFKLAQAQTFTLFTSLDRARKRIPLRLIYDLALIHKDAPLLSLKGAALDTADLHEITLLDSSLREADLRLADLTGANLRGSDFSWADLRGADLRLAVLTDASLEHANLLPYDHFHPAQLNFSHLLNSSDPSYVDARSPLDLARFGDRHLTLTRLDGANLQGANLYGAFLYRANLGWATLTGAILTEADLRRTDLRRADLRRADLRGAHLKGAHLKGADLEGADLEGADLRDADLSDAWVTKGQLEQAESLGGTTMPDGSVHD